MHLASGGLDYPRFPPLESYLPELVEAPAGSGDLPDNPGQADQISVDENAGSDSDGVTGSPVSNGFTIALVVLIGMGLAIIYVIYALLKEREPGTSRRYTWLDWLVPIVALAGIAVAGYLTYVETQAVDAICGPIGDCNSVQSSPYSKIFGILPVGILGLIGYVAILIAWAIQKFRQDKWGELRPVSHACDGFIWHAVFDLPDLPGNVGDPGGLHVVRQLCGADHLFDVVERPTGR